MNKNTTPTSVQSPRAAAQQKYNVARANLILMVGLTVLNVILALTGSDTMMLFSATIPYLATVFASLSQIQVVTVVLMGIGIVNIAVYFVCWLLSKKHFGWMIASLVFFVVDTFVLIAFYILAGEISGILDLAIHVWVLYYLVLGVANGAKLRTLPEETEQEETPPQATLNGEVIESVSTEQNN